MSSTEDIETKIPPPPPLPKKVEIKPTESNVVQNFRPTEALWGSSYPELQRACFLAQIALHRAPVACKFKEFPGILQEGPTCGLAALSMLVNSKISAKDLLQQSISKSFTNNGEMFSAVNLHTLLRLNLQYLNSNVETCLYNGLLDSESIKSELQSGSILLVPYDADVVHTPATLKGHKAHWALIVGYLITESQEFYVLARHGKSKYLAVWPLKHLSDSNANLLEFAQPKKHENQVFLLPEGGIGGDNGLCQKCIIIKGVENKEFVL